MLLLELLHLQELLLEGQLLVPQRLPRQKEGQIQALFPAWQGRRGLEAAARGAGSEGWQRWGHGARRCLHPAAGPARLPAEPDGGFDLSEEEGKEREKGKGKKIKRWKEREREELGGCSELCREEHAKPGWGGGPVGEAQLWGRCKKKGGPSRQQAQNPLIRHKMIPVCQKWPR